MAGAHENDDSASEARLDRIHQIVDDCMVRRTKGELISDESIIAANPGLMPELGDWLRGLRLLDGVKDNEGDATRADGDEGPSAETLIADGGPQPLGSEPFPALQIRCPRCQQAVDVSSECSFEQLHCHACDEDFSLVGDAEETAGDPGVFSLGHFQLLQRLGAGGYGTVWKARDTMLDRIVAVKVPRQGQLTAEDCEKFLREARAAAQLKHPNIVSIHEIGRFGETIYIVSDIIDGVSLASWLSAKQPTLAEAAALCIKIADALDHSHRAGVVHRDLKPQNILMDAAGEPHVADFGLARREFGETTMTIDGQVLGTPAYMSPEQASGQSHEADCRSDIYSLGVILFRLLTGELPFRGNASMLMHQVLHDEPPSPRKLDAAIPRDLETICLKCLEKDAGKRYQKARELAQELGRFLRHEPIQARPISATARTWRWCKRNPTVARLLATVGGVLVAGTVVSWYFAAAAITARTRLTKTSFEIANYASRTKSEGYREPIWDLIRQTMDGGGADRRRALRLAAVAVMGDFVGLKPILCGGFDNDHEVTAMAVHPREAVVAVGLGNGQIRFVSRVDGAISAELPAHQQAVIGLAFDEQGIRFASVDAIGGLRFWKADASGEWRLVDETQIEAFSAKAQSARFTPDLKYLLTSSSNDVVLTQLDTGHPKFRRPVGQTEELSAAACSDDGRLLAMAFFLATDKNRIVVVDPARPSFEHELPPAESGDSYISALAFSSDGNDLLCACEEELIHFTRVLGSETIAFSRKPVVRTDANQALAFSPDNQFSVSVDLRGVVTVRSASNDAQLAVVKHRPKGQPKYQGVAFGPKREYLAAANHNSVKFWHLAGVTERKTFAGHAGSIPTLVFGPDNNRLISGGKDGQVVVWDSHGAILSRDEKRPGKVQCVAIDASGERLATARWESGVEAIEIWRLGASGRIAEPVNTIEHGLGNVNRLVFFGKSSRLEAAGDGGVLVWEIPTQRTGGQDPHVESRTVVDNKTPEVRFRDVAVSSDEKLLAYSENDEEKAKVRVWDLAANEQMSCEAPDMLQGWHALAFVPNSHDLIFVDRDGSGVVWNIQDDTLRRKLADAETFAAPHVALSGNGRWFAGLVESNAVGVWHRESGEHMFNLRPERAAIWALAWSPDETQLALGLSDGGLTVWDLDLVNEALKGLGLNWPDVGKRPER